MITQPPTALRLRLSPARRLRRAARLQKEVAREGGRAPRYGPRSLLGVPRFLLTLVWLCVCVSVCVDSGYLPLPREDRSATTHDTVHTCWTMETLGLYGLTSMPSPSRSRLHPHIHASLNDPSRRQGPPSTDNASRVKSRSRAQDGTETGPV